MDKLWYTLAMKFVAQLLSNVQLFATPWTAACQASLSFTISLSLLKLMSIDSMIPSKQRHHNFYLGSQESWASLSSMSLACPPSLYPQGHASPSPGCLPPPLPLEMPHLGSPQRAVWPWHRNQYVLGLLVTMIVTSSIDRNSNLWEGNELTHGTVLCVW